jgi:hypothetical protein
VTADTLIVTIDPVAEEAVRGELQQDERLVWCGRPNTTRWFMPADWLLIPISLMWGGFAVFWEVGVLTAKTTSGSDRYDLFFRLWGVPFVAIGVYLIVGRFFARRYFGRRTAYAITTSRALVNKPAWRGGQQTTSVWFASSPPVSRRAASDGHGTVLLGSLPMPQMAAVAGDPGWMFGRGLGHSLVAFWNINDASEVGALATRLIAEART